MRSVPGALATGSQQTEIAKSDPVATALGTDPMSPGANPKAKSVVSKKPARPSVQTEFGRAFLLNRAMRVLFNLAYAVNEEPHPQLPVEFGLLKVKPEPITFWT